MLRCVKVAHITISQKNSVYRSEVAEQVPLKLNDFFFLQSPDFREILHGNVFVILFKA